MKTKGLPPEVVGASHLSFQKRRHKERKEAGSRGQCRIFVQQRGRRKKSEARPRRRLLESAVPQARAVKKAIPLWITEKSHRALCVVGWMANFCGGD